MLRSTQHTAPFVGGTKNAALGRLVWCAPSTASGQSREFVAAHNIHALGRCGPAPLSDVGVGVGVVYVSMATDSDLCAPASDARPNDSLLPLCAGSPVGYGWSQPLRSCRSKWRRECMHRVARRPSLCERHCCKADTKQQIFVREDRFFKRSFSVPTTP